MTPDEAQQLAQVIATTWPAAKITASVWFQPLERLNLKQATMTYEWLRDRSQRAPTVATFLAKNRELHHDLDPIPARTPCVTCDGIGWIWTTTVRSGHPFPTTGVHPCRCPNGRQYEQAWRRALDENTATLAGTGRPIAQGGGGYAQDW